MTAARHERVRFSVTETRETHMDFETFAADANWFHAIKVGNVRTCGRFDGDVQNRTLLGAFDMLNNIDVGGLDCLDIGTVDGIVTFALRARGADRVVATDRVHRPTFPAVQEALGLDGIDYQPRTELSDMLDRYDGHRFDLIVCAGVIYHMLNPFTAFQICRRLLKTGGLLVLETAADFRNPDAATITINSEETLFDETATYSVPTPAAVRGMMKLAGFDVLDERWQRGLRRFAAVGRAAPVDQVTGRTPMLAAMQRQGYVDYTFSPERPDVMGDQQIFIDYRGASGQIELTTADEARVTFSLHPTPDEIRMMSVAGERHEWNTVASFNEHGAR